MPQAQPRQRQEPQRTGRAEEQRHPRRPAALHGKKRDQDPHGHPKHIRLQRRQDQSHPLNRRQDRDRRRDRRIPGEKGRPAQRQQEDRHRPPPRCQPHQRVKCQDPALAPVVGAQKEEDVFHRDDQDQRPDQQGQDAQHLGLPRNRRPGGAQGLAEGIDRRGADIAIDHPDRAKAQRGKPLPVRCVVVDVRRGLLLGLEVVGDVQRLVVKKRQGRLDAARNGVVNHESPWGAVPVGQWAERGNGSRSGVRSRAFAREGRSGPPLAGGVRQAPIP